MASKIIKTPRSYRDPRNDDTDFFFFLSTVHRDTVSLSFFYPFLHNACFLRD